MKRIIILTLLVLTLSACFKKYNEAAMAIAFTPKSQQGLLIGSFTITGYAESAPVLEFTNVKGSIVRSITANKGMFGFKSDTHRAAASLFSIELPPGVYYFRNVSMTTAKTFGYYTHVNTDSDDLRLKFTIESGKITYIGDLMAEYSSGFGGFSPKLRDFQVRDLWQADKTYFHEKFSYLEGTQPIINTDFFEAFYQRQAEYKAKLSSNDETVRIQTLKEMYNTKYNEVELLEYLSQLLISNATDPDANQEDYYAWIARVLGASDREEYIEVLQHTIANTSSSKIERHAKNALEMLISRTS
ncbi:hypothetical protein [Kangiella sp. M94]